MEIEIKIKRDPKAEPELRKVEDNSTIEDLLEEIQKELPYRIIAARRNNVTVPLTNVIDGPCEITLLDMRDPSANQIYQRSVIFLYLKAVFDVLGTNNVVVANSLNKGIYTEIRTAAPVTMKEIHGVERRMKELYRLDLPIERKVLERDEAIALLEKAGYSQRLRLVRNSPELDTIPVYSIEGFYSFYYSFMVPSTGYIDLFELRKCRRGVVLRFPEPARPDVLPEYRDDVKLYNAFGEATKWGQLMGIRYVEDLNDKIEDGTYRQVIQTSEALHEKKIAQFADMIARQGKRMILIAGPSSSGKTTFAQRLCTQLRVNGLSPLYMGTDDYFVERADTPKDENGEPNFEDIDAIDLELFNSNMNALLRGDEVDLPVFDFVTGTKQYGKRITRAQKGQPIVIEGIHGLNRTLTAGIPDDAKFKIYISPLTQLHIDDHNRIPTTDARMLRRIVRDYQFRGHTAQSTIRQWPKVRAGEDKNIFPFNGEADVLFNSVHIYELAVLKKYAEPLLMAIRPDEPEFCEAVRMLKFLKYFRTIEDDSIIVNNSIIREFIGGSVYVD
ncbi:nucleoside kinase [Bacilliculturomica massiliensis]|uniref:nucleoside kinase n=1 Tax=Bacilliculturomica massiliensis TaxID=1917867 RepID=UPI001031BA2F|nr:nucleoside kinase [Bacilliculturomica massiliensis]